jgi:hypothetical protein
MGRVYRRKRRSCPMCKPNKTGQEPRWTPQEYQKIKQMEKEAREEK